MQVYNADETGVTIVHKPGRIIAELGRQHVYIVTSAEKGLVALTQFFPAFQPLVSCYHLVLCFHIRERFQIISRKEHVVELFSVILKIGGSTLMFI